MMLSRFCPRLIRVLYSLRLRLILLFMLVVMVAVGTIALLVSQATATNLQVYTQTIDQQKTSQQSISMLLAAYQQHQSQSALQMLTEKLAHSTHQRIILFDHQKHVITDSERQLIGQVLPESGTSFSSVVVSTDGDHTLPALYLSTDSSAQPTMEQGSITLASGSPEATFLTSVNRALWLAVLIAGLIALLLALLFANTLLRPLHTLKAVAGRMELGDLSQRVSINEKGEIGELAHAFNAMAESLSRSEQIRRNLVNDVAHELRNPLMNIRGYLELLTEGVLRPTVGTLASLYEETSLLSRLVADLQELSLAEAGQLPLTRRPVEIAEVISQTVQIVQPQLEQKHLSLHVYLPVDLPLICADPERVAQILRNLVRNAITYTSTSGEINITASRSEAWVHVSVQDTGVGIAPEHLSSLFERFYRADPSRARATGGTGLGLAIVKQMVQAHGGQITVASQEGKGACFTFTLPVVSNRVMQREK